MKALSNLLCVLQLLCSADARPANVDKRNVLADLATIVGGTGVGLVQTLAGANSARSMAMSEAPVDTAVLELFAAYSGAAYTVSDKWDCKYACEYPGTKQTVIEYSWNVGSPPSAGYIARNPDKGVFVVSFQGTHSPEQWVQNLQTSQEEWPKSVEGSQVHSGFLSGYSAARTGMLSAVLQLADAYPNYSIALVGHSLGGARAALALLDLATTAPQLVPRLSMYTYGAPRVGNGAFAKAIEGLSVPVYRVVYEDDVVPHLPPSYFGYVHHNIEDWIHDGRHQFCLSTEQSDTCSNGGGSLTVNISAHYGYPGLKYS